MTASVSGIQNQNAAATKTSISSLKEIESNPEFFPLWIEQLQRNNLSNLLSATNTFDQDTDDSSGNSLFGLENSDPFAGLGISSGSDPLSSIFSSQGMSSDFSFMTPTASLNSLQVSETLKGFAEYTNLKENMAWVGQLVSYLDPVTQELKSGRVTKVDVENVNKPIFTINDEIEITQENIQELLAGEMDANLSA
jgi:hypothetical protein